MSLLTERSDIALPLRLAAFRSALPIAQLLNILNPLKYIEHQPVIYCIVDGCPKPVPSYELSETLKKCADITEEEKAIAELPPEWFLLMSQLDSFAFSIIDEYMDMHDEYELPSDFDKFPYQELLGECKHILKLDVEKLFKAPSNEGVGEHTNSPSSEATEQPSNIFRQKKTGTWEVRFNGKSCPSLQHRVGFQYIRMLLASPRKEFSANEIDYSGVPDTSEAVVPEVLTKVDSFSGADVPPDKTAIAEYKKRLPEIDEEIEEAIKNGDEERHKDLEYERDSLLEQVKEASTARIRSARGLPEDGSIQKKSQDKVNSNIKNAIKYIDEHIPELGTHFEESIRRGAKNYYKPSDPTTWVVS